MSAAPTRGSGRQASLPLLPGGLARTPTARPGRRGPSASRTSASSRRPSSSALFVFLLWVTWFSRLKGYPVSLFLEMDPLVGFATALSTHTVYRCLWRGLFVLVPTLLLGRVFCNWICPYGTLHQFIGWLFNIRNNKDRIDTNRYRPIFQLKYVILGVFLVLAAFGSLQIGLLDPICLLVRTFTVTVVPAVDWAPRRARRAGPRGRPRLVVFKPAAPEPRVFAGAWFVGRC